MKKRCRGETTGEKLFNICLLLNGDNHVHLLVNEGDETISQIMEKINACDTRLLGVASNQALQG
ncbi:hypothetical protein [Sporomusa acidovorans]|uniref:hypothetical protein n=1 Tax=Sporomusa acidovorans TaxID=112900 RepID=UPI000B99F1E5